MEFGFVQNNILRLLYSNAFALIYPSDYEGFGLPLLEAMACGCPVIASNLSSLPEVGGKAVIYANYQNEESYSLQLNKLLTSEYRNNLIKKGIFRSHLFTWEKTFQMHLNLYE